MSQLSKPPLQLRPKLASYLFERGLRAVDVAGHLGVQANQIRRYCMPFGSTLRAIPSIPVMEKVVEWSGGEITPADFYPPHLNQPAATAEAAE